MKTFYWSRSPGKFIDSKTGDALSLTYSPGPMFTGTVREWYEIIVAVTWNAGLTLQGALPFSAVCHPDVFLLYECSMLFLPSLTDATRGEFACGFSVQKNPSQPRNIVKIFNDTSECQLKILDMVD